MAILGITNRTENWKTARYFAPLMGAKSVHLARRLLPLEEAAELREGHVRMELFWCGMRDYISQYGRKTAVGKEAQAQYSTLFGDLSEKVMEFKVGGRKFRAPEGSYDLSSKGGRTKLTSNLSKTEIDIVLESPDHLFIGEAKHESGLGADGKDFLTHQLIRQYVMARILLKLREDNRKVVPFVVSDDRESIKKTLQVRFMQKQRWLREANILQWSDIEALR